MSNLKRATIKDMKIGRWLWAEFETAFNGEGSISCPAKVTAVDNKEVFLMVFGEDFGIGGIRRGRTIKGSLKSIREKKAGIFIPNQTQMAAHIAKEVEWIESQQKFLANYAEELKSALK